MRGNEAAAAATSPLLLVASSAMVGGGEAGAAAARFGADWGGCLGSKAAGKDGRLRAGGR